MLKEIFRLVHNEHASHVLSCMASAVNYQLFASLSYYEVVYISAVSSFAEAFYFCERSVLRFETVKV